MAQDKATERREDRAQPGRDQDRDRATSQPGQPGQGRDRDSRDENDRGGGSGQNTGTQNRGQAPGQHDNPNQGNSGLGPQGEASGEQTRPGSQKPDTNEDWSKRQPHEKDETKQGGDCGCG